MLRADAATTIGPRNIADLTCRLEFLGGARLLGPRGEVQLHRKAAAVLAYLALEGETQKYRLAGWLWPEVPETTARNNMRQLLKRLREASGLEVVVGTDRICLAPGVKADAADVEALAFAGEHAAATLLEGELLAGLDFDDCPDFADWLQGARDGLNVTRQAAASAEAERRETNGDFSGAIDFARRALELDVVSEASHRRLMRLHYLTGDRGAALAAFERCRQILRDEFGAEPLPETQELAREIERGAVRSAPRTTNAIPLTVLRPPSLIGRDREWAALEEAWQAGQTVCISGEPGLGKSRLALDFAGLHGPLLRLDGRPGDSGVPYAVLTRALRQSLSERPLLSVPAWVRRELSRILPELAEDGAPLPPILNEGDKARFFDACREALRLVSAGEAVVVADDLHHHDLGSLDFLKYFVAASYPLRQPDGIAGFVLTYRENELPPGVNTDLRSLADSGLARVIELSPLDEAGVESLLEGLNLPDPLGLVQPLARFTGGNPLFVLETVKHLIESGGLTHGWPGRLPPPGKVGPVIERRLSRLSENALRLARTAAVLGSDFDLSAAAVVLQTDALTLAGTWEELVNAQVVRGAGFTHELMLETVLASTPAPVRALLHCRAADALAARETNPAKVAEHWLAGGDPLKAAPFLERAGNNACHNFRLAEGADLYERAAAIFEQNSAQPEAFRTMLALARLLLRFDFGPRAENVTARLVNLARTHEERARAWRARAELLFQRGDLKESEEASRSGLGEARATGEARLRSELLLTLGESLWRQQDYPQAVTTLEKARQLAEPLGDEDWLATVLDRLAMTLDRMDKYVSAIPHYRRAASTGRNPVERAERLINLGASLANTGRIREGLPSIEEAVALLEASSGVDNTLRHALAQLGISYGYLGDYSRSLDLLERAVGISVASDLPRGFLHGMLARVYVVLGLHAETEAQLEAAESRSNLSLNIRIRVHTTRGRLQLQSGLPASSSFRAAERLLAGASGWLATLFKIDAAAERAPQEGLVLAQEALRTARQPDLDSGGLAIGAASRAASALLKLGRPREALEHSRIALSYLENFDPVDFYRPEALLTHARALEAAGSGDPEAVIAEALAWVLGAADHHVRPEHRASFLGVNPTNHALLRQAHLYGLWQGDDLDQLQARPVGAVAAIHAKPERITL